MSMMDALFRAIAEAEEDAIFGRLCRCGCRNAPQTDHYLPPGALEAWRALIGDVEEMLEDQPPMTRWLP